MLEILLVGVDACAGLRYGRDELARSSSAYDPIQVVLNGIRQAGFCGADKSGEE